MGNRGEKLKSPRDEMSSLGEGDIPGPENVRKVHCSNGVTTCKDIDPSQPCICGGCAVWQEYGLAGRNPAEYFCKNGRAR